MVRAIFIFFTILTVGSIYLTYQGIGLQEAKINHDWDDYVTTDNSSYSNYSDNTVRSSSSSSSSSYGGSSGGYSYGK